MAFIDAMTCTVPLAVLLGSMLALIVIVVSALYITVTKPFDEPVSWRAVRMLSHFLLLTSAGISYYVSFHWVTAIILLGWIAVLAATPFLRARLEEPQYQRSLARLAKQGTNLVLFLRPFKLDHVTAGIQKAVHATTTSTFKYPIWNLSGMPLGIFTVEPLALGRDDKANFAKLETADASWWKYLTAAAGNSVAIFILPLLSDSEDDTSGLAQEMSHILRNEVGKVIVIMPAHQAIDNEQLWQNARQWCKSSRFKLQLPEYRRRGGLITLRSEACGVVACQQSYSLTKAGIAAALQAVTSDAQIKHKGWYREFRKEFAKRNGGTYPENYYRGTEKKLPPNLPY